MRKFLLGVFLFNVLFAGSLVLAEQKDELRRRAALIQREAIVIDGHNDIPTIVFDFGFDLGFDGSDPAKRDVTLHWFPFANRLVSHLGGDQIRTDTDIRRLELGGVNAQFFSICPCRMGGEGGA